MRSQGANTCVFDPRRSHKRTVLLCTWFSVRNALQNVTGFAMIVKRREYMYEYFELDVGNTSFEWDEERLL